MKRPKNFLFPTLLVSVVAVVLVVVIHTARVRHPTSQTSVPMEASRRSPSPTFVSDATPPDGTPSPAARQRAKEFNDATNRFNAPDDQQR